MPGNRVDSNGTVVITDPNSPAADSAILKWGPNPGDRSSEFVVSPVGNTTLASAGITVAGQYYMAATLTAGGVESNESNEVPFELVPMAPTLDVVP